MSISVGRSSILAISFLLAPFPTSGGCFELISGGSVEGEVADFHKASQIASIASLDWRDRHPEALELFNYWDAQSGLETPAVATANSWRLESAGIYGKPVEVKLPMPFKFSHRG